jgi:hypothetical protein
LGSWLGDVTEDELVEGADFTEALRAVLEVGDETLFFRDAVDLFGPAFEVADASSELDAELTVAGGRVGHKDLLRAGKM